jgi:hypothetical protein
MVIPILGTPDRELTSTTQDMLPVADIVDGIVVYKTGGAALIMESTSLNFGLLSEPEQDAVIASYAGLLNSFNFPVQIMVRSQKKEIGNYMKYLDEAQKNIKSPLLVGLMNDYKNFVLESVKKKNVLSKRFFIVVPFTPFELGLAKSVSATFRTGKSVTLPFPKSYVVRKAKTTLYPKRDHLIRQAARMNLKFKPLSTEELIALFYSVYNPEMPVKETGYFV